MSYSCSERALFDRAPLHPTHALSDQAWAVKRVLGTADVSVREPMVGLVSEVELVTLPRRRSDLSESQNATSEASPQESHSNVRTDTRTASCTKVNPPVT